MNQIPKIDCPFHGKQVGTETEFGVYKCPRCHEFDKHFAPFDALIKAIRENRPIETTPEIRALAKKAAEQQYANKKFSPEEIEKWARRLAEDVAGADD